MNTAYIAFGSNIGDSLVLIEKAMLLMEKRGIHIVKKSNIYETKPYGYLEQPNFTNGAIEIRTLLNCRELLYVLLDIELELGRIREFKWGPRCIDLDIIFFNKEIYNEQELIVPHPDMQNRDFVIKPLMDLCPEYIHPILKKSVKEIFEELKNSPT
jgi:2-amino-4-hydroxy-6-hydroxymethyldihydropteridine diphosphokinase